jgi:signal transduction histidine kinase
VKSLERVRWTWRIAVLALLPWTAVAAQDRSGLLQRAGATLSFMIDPAVLQTVWFKILCGVLIFIFLWLIYLLRLRQMTLRLRLRLEERYNERERIARELHDTLLQGVQGLILRFHAIAGRISDPETRRMIDQTLDQADVILEQGRDRVRSLRDLSQPIDDLAEGLAAFGQECAQLHQASFKVQQQYRTRGIDPIVRDEICQISREALYNAFQHAQAQNIEVDISYGSKELRLRVRDDGKGIAAEVLENGGREGHFGLSGMRERARRIKAELQIWSRDGLGTEVELRIPAAVAYCGRPTKSWLMRVFGRAVAEDVIP